MSSEVKVKVHGGGVGFLGLLTLLFIGLKLGNVIDWSWWWVMAPLWIPFAVVFGIIAIVLLAMGILTAFDKLFRKKKKKGPFPRIYAE